MLTDPSGIRVAGRLEPFAVGFAGESNSKCSAIHCDGAALHVGHPASGRDAVDGQRDS
jgi:hypothetical protein